MWAIYQNWDYDGDRYYGFYSTKELAEKELERLTRSSGYEIIKLGVDEPADFHPDDTKEYWESLKKKVEEDGPYYDGDPGLRKSFKSDLVLDMGVVYKDANIEELKTTTAKLMTGVGVPLEVALERLNINLPCNCACGGQCEKGDEE